MATKFGLIYHIFLMGFLISSVVIGHAEASQAKKDTPAVKDNQKNAEFPEEDSDMLMEPNDFSSITVLRSQEQQFQPIPPPLAYQQRLQHHAQPPQIAARIDAPPPPPPAAAAQQDSHTQAAQNYYPPFFREAPPLGHSRPYFTTPDVPLIPKYAVPLPNPTATAVPPPSPQRNFDTALLGSGDFGVIRGGTFYPEEEMPYHPEDNSDFSDYYGDANNGHGRPANDGFIQKYTYPEEQFANFRDFADINTPADGAFSQFVVVYAAKNATKPSNHPHPKNIFEQLELLDREKEMEEKKSRPSKSKSKLGKTKLQKKYKKKTNPKDFEYEPLLALS